MTQGFELVVRNIHSCLVGITKPHYLGGRLVVCCDCGIVEARPPTGADKGVSLPLRLLFRHRRFYRSQCTVMENDELQNSLGRKETVSLADM